MLLGPEVERLSQHPDVLPCTLLTAVTHPGIVAVDRADQCYQRIYQFLSSADIHDDKVIL